MECKKLFHLDSLMRTRLTPDSSKLIMSTSGGFYLVIHDLDLDALASDFEDHDPSEYAEILQNGSPHDLKGHRSNEMFHRPRNRAEIVMDFPKEGSGQCISSLVVHPQAWCMVSRYTNDQEDQEVGRGDWTFAPVRILTIANIRNLAKRWCLSCKLCMLNAGSIPIVCTSICFLPFKMYTGITNILEFDYKTDMF